MPRLVVCVSCAARAAIGDARVAGGEWQPVCSEACAQQMIGPKRPAEDAVDEEPPRMSQLDIANSLAKLGDMLMRIANLENYVIGEGSTRWSRQDILTNLQLPIGGGIIDKTTLIDKLVELHGRIIAAITAVAAGTPTDYQSIRAAVASLVNRLADDQTITHYLEMQDHAALGRVIPLDVQRIIARKAFPIQVISYLRFTTRDSSNTTLGAFVAVRNLLAFVYATKNRTFIAKYQPDGTLVEQDAPFRRVAGRPLEKMIVRPIISSSYSGYTFTETDTLSKTANRKIFTSDERGLLWVHGGGNIRSYDIDNKQLTHHITSNNAKIESLLSSNFVADKASRRTARQSVIGIASGATTFHLFDMANDTEIVVDTSAHSLNDIDSIAFDDGMRPWISTGFTVSVFTPNGQHITTEMIRDIGIAPEWPDWGKPTFLRAVDGLMWLAFTCIHPLRPIVAIAMRLTPEPLN